MLNGFANRTVAVRSIIKTAGRTKEICTEKQKYENNPIQPPPTKAEIIDGTNGSNPPLFIKSFFHYVILSSFN